MDINLVKLLMVLFPGVAAYVVSERLIERMGRGRATPLKATVGMLCLSAWSIALYTILLKTTTLESGLIALDRLFSTSSTASLPSIREVIRDFPDLAILVGIGIGVGICYSLIKKWDIDGWFAKLLGAKHKDRTEVWYDFKEAYEKSNCWVRVDFDDDTVAIGYIKSISVSRDIDSLLILGDVTVYKDGKQPLKELLTSASELGEYEFLLIDTEKSNVKRILVLKGEDSSDRSTEETHNSKAGGGQENGSIESIPQAVECGEPHQTNHNEARIRKAKVGAKAK